MVAVLVFVLRSSGSSQTISKARLANASSVTNPLDQISSADIAVNVARLTNLYESPSVTNDADSINAKLAISQASVTVVAKPQIVSTDLKSIKDLQKYITKPGDSVSKIAAKFKVTSDTIRWSNGLSSDALAVGTTIYVVPGVNGIIYKVKPGDTPAKLATKFKADKDQIVAYNDAELRGLKVGSIIIIPNGTKQETVYAGSYFGGFSPSYNGNGYAYGFCTWYAASKVAVPGNWGNANTWDDLARISGWTVSSVPRVGAVAQTDGMSYLGHVGVVDAVSPDGKMIKYSDMNGLAGWGVVGYSDWVPASKFEHYIYR